MTQVFDLISILEFEPSGATFELLQPMDIDKESVINFIKLINKNINFIHICVFQWKAR